MLDAVLFDWADTLMSYDVDADFACERVRAGLAALEREGLPDADAVCSWLRDSPDGGGEDEQDYIALLTACFAELGCDLGDDDVRLYADAALWERELALHQQTPALLASLRDRGLRLGLVSNTPLPGWLLAPVFEGLGLAQQLDTIVLSSEVGKRKPHPAIFERALGELEVAPERALFVGDRLYQDVRGAAGVGMKTAQALWFRADDDPDGAEPDFQAFTQTDVLTVVERLRSA